MNEIIIYNKPLGITSYDVVRDLKKQYPGQKIGHAGTLDPLASGVLICLVGSDATKRQSEFMDVDKEYVFTVLLGFETDTYDVLGLVINRSSYDVDQIKAKCDALVKSFKGDIKQPVPPFSAVKINGKPLYRWYLDGKIKDVEIPVKDIHINEIEILDFEVLSAKDTKDMIVSIVDTVKSGFRQDKVLSGWDVEFQNTKQQNFLLIKIRAAVSKGTYVRAIAQEIGKQLEIGACTTTIMRTRVGEYRL